jgi:hypothetical protein
MGDDVWSSDLPELGCVRDGGNIDTQLHPKNSSKGAIMEHIVFIFRGVLTDRADIFLNNPFPMEIYLALQPVLEKQPSKEFYFWRSVAAPNEPVTWCLHT